jgi:hypothetical protein
MIPEGGDKGSMVVEETVVLPTFISEYNYFIMYKS